MEEKKPQFKRVRLPKEAKTASKDSGTRHVHESLKRKPLTPAFINKNLKAIYKEEDGSMPNMHHFAHGGLHRWRRIALVGALVLLLCSAAAWAGFFIFGSRGPSFSSDGVRVDITGPSSTGIGEEMTYHVRVSNDQSLQLSETELMVQYPDGFVVSDTSLLPTDDQRNKWRFGVLDPGEQAEVDITGVLYGQMQQQQSLRAFFTYHPSNFNSDFQNVATFTQTLDRSPLSMDWAPPMNAAPGQNLDIPVALENITDTSVGPVELHLDLGQHFGILPPDKQHPEKLPDGVTHPEPLVWKIEQLQPHAKLSFPLRGAFTADAAEKEHVNATVSAIIRDTPYDLAHIEQDITISYSTLMLSLVANGSTGSAITVAPEDTLAFSLFYKNTGKDAIKNLTLSTIFDSPVAGGTSVLMNKTVNASVEPAVHTEDINVDTRRIILEWAKKQSGSLASVAVNTENSIPFTMALASKSAIDYRKLSQFTIIVHAEGEYDNGTKVSMQTQPITVNIASDTDLSVGIEPVDPNTLETTSDATDAYRITWKFSNSVHPLKDLSVKANMVGDIEWLGQDTTAGTVAFDSATKNVRWSIPSIAGGTNNQEASFIIRVKGTAPGQRLLMTASTLEATDTVVNKSVVRTNPAIDLPSP